MALQRSKSRALTRAAAAGAVAALITAGALQAGASQAASFSAHTPHGAGSTLGVVRVHGAGSRHRAAADMIYNGGTVMTTAATEAIFWGPSWANSSFVGDKV